MQDRRHELRDERIARLLLKYSTPAVLAMFTNSLYNLVDTIFVGRGAGTLALAGLAIAFPIQMFILAIAQVVGIGSASLISRSLGAGDQRKAERTAGTSFATVAVLSALLATFGLLFLNPIIRLFGATPTVLPYTADYLSIILLGSFFFAFAVSSNNIVRAEGNAKVAMISMMLGAGVNIALDPVFIFGFGMGIRGAAIATVIAQFTSFVFLVGYFWRGNTLLRIRRQDLVPDLSVLPEVFAVGSSSFGRVAAGSVMSVVLNNSIAHYGGDVHLAILGIVHRVILFVLMPQFGLVQGLLPIIGFNYGARNTGRVKEAIGHGILAATVMSTLGFVLLMGFPKIIFGLFSRDVELIGEGACIMRVIVIAMPVIGFQAVGAGLFQAIGKAGPALFLSMSRQVLFLVPLILVIPLWLQLAGIWVSFPLADGLSACVTAGWVLSEMRQLNRMAPKP
ncbi:MAG TPA: MATE family efflux transporter [Candidatus Hydrogenedentes bacterium]|nr:MATE family efflux transporter [Candidatus Hydrogenedentota bacterium]HPG67356.1 MATE family efflux transporter [Candidatus Hydrogenedentota bacterium]